MYPFALSFVKITNEVLEAGGRYGDTTVIPKHRIGNIFSRFIITNMAIVQSFEVIAETFILRGEYIQPNPDMANPKTEPPSLHNHKIL